MPKEELSMKILPIAAAAALVLVASGCASEPTELPETPDAVVDETDNDTGATPDSDAGEAVDSPIEIDGSTGAGDILDTFQVEQLLLSVEKSIELAEANGHVEEYSFPETPDDKETLLFDADKPIESSSALDLGVGLALPNEVSSLEGALSGLFELRGEANGMLGLLETGAEEARQYVNIITNDGFIFNGVTSGNRFYATTNEDGIITGFTETIGESERTHAFTYELTDGQRDLITEAYNLDFTEQ
jgi:hypothetical protein